MELDVDGGKRPGGSRRFRSFGLRATAVRSEIVEVLEKRLALGTDTSGGPDACWLWGGATSGYTNYGQMPVPSGYWPLGAPKRAQRTHVIAWELANGRRAKKGDVVRHGPTCVSRLCCNPAHLTIGTQQDNIDDMLLTATRPRGEKHYAAKATEALVLEIRRLATEGMKYKDIATKLDISYAMARSIATGKRWAHVEGVPAPGPRLRGE